MAAQTAPKPVATYKIVNPNTFRDKYLELQSEGKTFLWITNGRRRCFSSSPPFTLHTGSADGPIVAAARFPTLGHDIRILLGDPGAQPPPQWHELVSSMTSREYTFRAIDGRMYVWRRTHDEALGASSWRSGDFKLLDLDNSGGNGAAAAATTAANDDGKARNSQVLAVYVKDRETFGSASAGRIDWMVRFEPQTELFLLTAVLMIEAQLRARRRNNAAAAGAAGGSC